MSDETKREWGMILDPPIQMTAEEAQLFLRELADIQGGEMSWSFSYVGDVPGIIEALEDGGGMYDPVSRKLIKPETYTRAVKEIVNHLTLQNQSAEIGWQVEAWGGGPSLHIDIKPVNLRVGRTSKGSSQ